MGQPRSMPNRQPLDAFKASEPCVRLSVEAGAEPPLWPCTHPWLLMLRALQGLLSVPIQLGLLETILSVHGPRTLALIRLLIRRDFKRHLCIIFFFKELKRENGSQAFLKIFWESEGEWQGRPGFKRMCVFVWTRWKHTGILREQPGSSCDRRVVGKRKGKGVGREVGANLATLHRACKWWDMIGEMWQMFEKNHPGCYEDNRV